MVIDAQSVKTSANVPTAGQGADVGKKIVGRKRSVVIDTTGLLLAVLVTTASIQDSTAGETLLTRIAAAHPTLRKGWADRGYREYLVDHAACLGTDLETVRRTPGGARGFTVQPRRWCVERTLGWLMLNRRLTRDYEALPARSTGMIYVAMIALTRRLTRESTPTWRGT